MSDKIPEKIQTMRAWPTLPLFLSTPLGDTKIPAPTIMPTMIATPFHRLSSFFSLTPSLSLLDAAVSGRRTDFSAGATLSGIFRASWTQSPFSKLERARAHTRARERHARFRATIRNTRAAAACRVGITANACVTTWDAKRKLRKISGRKNRNGENARALACHHVARNVSRDGHTCATYVPGRNRRTAATSRSPESPVRSPPSPTL